MNACNIYFDSKHVYVIASGETTHGFNIAIEPMFKLPRTVTPARLGATVVTALSAYRRGISGPSNLARTDNALLKFMGYKSWSSFERQAQCVLVESEGQTTKATPTVLGADGGFLFMPEQAAVTDTEPDHIGHAILRALESCPR